MEFLGAFLVCGLICTLAQLLVEILPDTYGPTLFILIQALGAILVPTGVVAALTALGGAGIVITVFNAGAGACDGVLAILRGDGPFSFLLLFGVFLVVAVVGIIAGATYVRAHGADADRV